MSLEREVMLLRSARDENLIDQSRHKFILLSQGETINKLFSTVGILENFIIEQDEVCSHVVINDQCMSFKLLISIVWHNFHKYTSHSDCSNCVEGLLILMAGLV